MKSVVAVFPRLEFSRLLKHFIPAISLMHEAFSSRPAAPKATAKIAATRVIFYDDEG